MTYNAVDLARRLIKLSIENEIWLTNMKLQKLLYFAWKDYYREHRRYLFEDEIEAWKFGPVVPKVYHEYRFCASNIICLTKEPSMEMDSETDDFLLKTLIKYKDYSAIRLANMSHEEAPWKNNYVAGQYRTIPFVCMETEALARN